MGRPVAHRGSSSGESSEREAVAARRRRALEESLDVRLRSRDPVVDLEVRNPLHRTSYTVLFPEYPSRDSAICTCTDFARRGLGTCKHLEAGWGWLAGMRELPEVTLPGTRHPPVADLWKEIDRRQDQRRRSGPADIREVERAGTPLFDPEAVPEGPTRRGGAEASRPRAKRPPARTTSRGRA